VSDGLLTSENAATVAIEVSGLGAPPSGAWPDSFTVNEDAPLTIAAPGVLTNDGDRCSPPFTAELVSAPLRGTLRLNPNGGFDYTPSANFNGTDSFAYRARDGIFVSETAWVTLHVRPVNDPPVFALNLGNDFVFDDDGGPQRVEHFLTNRSAGPGEEEQALTLSVTTDRQDLFAQQPAMDETGALTFTPARNVRGTARISVVLMDGGGTSDGGVDASAPQTFTIGIQKPHPWHNTVVLAAPLAGALDVDQDGSIAPIDAVLVINFLNGEQTKVVSLDASIGGPSGMGAPNAFIDTAGGVDGRGDNFVSPLDAIVVINWLNANASARSTSGGAGPPSATSGAEGERSESRAADASNLGAIDSLMEALATAAASKAKRRRSGN
jgi:hypothetical protein